MSLGEQLGRLLIHEQVSEDEAKMRIALLREEQINDTGQTRKERSQCTTELRTAQKPRT